MYIVFADRLDKFDFCAEFLILWDMATKKYTE